MVQLNDELVATLDEEAARRGVSRSALIRSTLEEHLHSRSEELISRRIVAGYERIPPAAPDEWGDPSSLADRAVGDLLQRLDAEERTQGHEPW